MEARTSTQDRLCQVFQTLSGPEARLLWNVLAMHVENERCNDVVDDPEKAPAFKLAEGLLERVEAVLVSGI